MPDFELQLIIRDSNGEINDIQVWQRGKDLEQATRLALGYASIVEIVVVDGLKRTKLAPTLRTPPKYKTERAWVELNGQIVRLDLLQDALEIAKAFESHVAHEEKRRKGQCERVGCSTKKVEGRPLCEEHIQDNQ